MAAPNVSSAENLTEFHNFPENDGDERSFSKNFIEVAECEDLEIDLDVKCRGCFAEDPEMHYLFTVFDQKLSLADILMQTTPFECKVDDGFPPYLCTKCTTCLIDFFNFKTQFQKTDLYVRTLLEKSNAESFEAVTIKAEVHSDEGPGCEDTFEESDNEAVEEEKFCPDLNSIDDPTQHCKFCDIDFKDNDTRVTHMAKEHGQNPFLKYKTFRKMILENEKAAVLEKKRMKQMEEDLKEQILLEMPGKLCRFCRQKFPEDEFQAHWETHKTHICDQCGYKCIKKSDLDLHIQAVHSNERNFSCTTCGRKFKTKPLLKRHYTVHLNPRKYVCDLCGRRFNDSGVLKTHIFLKHVGNRDFICPICGRAFPMKATLEKHIFRHNKNRPPKFYCKLCPSSFRDKSSMTRHHLVKHTDKFERPICEHCGKSYSTKTKLRMHVEKIHTAVEIDNLRKAVRNHFKDEPYPSSEDEESEDSGDSPEANGDGIGPKVINVSEDFYKHDVGNHFSMQSTGDTQEYFVYSKEELKDEYESEY